MLTQLARASLRRSSCELMVNIGSSSRLLGHWRGQVILDRRSLGVCLRGDSLGAARLLLILRLIVNADLSTTNLLVEASKER